MARKLVRVEIAIAVDNPAEAERARNILYEAKDLAIVRFHRGDLPAIMLSADAIDRFLLWKSSVDGVHEDTLGRMRMRLLSFSHFLQSPSLPLITADDMAKWHRVVAARHGHSRRYLNERSGLCPDTIQKYLHALRQFCAWARDVAHAAPVDLPCERFRIKNTGKIKGNRYPPKALTCQELRRVVQLLSKKHEHIALVIVGMFLLGARPVQLFRLRWSDIRKPTIEHQGRIDLLPCKGAPERSIPFHRGSQKETLFLRCAELFSAFRKRKPKRDDYVFIPAHPRSRCGWSTSVFDHRLRQVCSALHIHEFVAYATRHTLGTVLQQSSPNAATVQATMGHSNVTTQEVYSWRTGSDAVEGLSIAEGLLAGMVENSTPERKHTATVGFSGELPKGIRLI